MMSKQTALVADDSVQVQRIVTHILKDDLHFGQVISVGNGKQALSVFERTSIDWVFSDWEMPVMGGEELIMALRHHPRGQRLPVVLMTGYADKKTLEAAILAGVDDFIAKPFSSTTFTQKVKRIAAAMERRAAARIIPKSEVSAEITFGCGSVYPAELVNISSTGCLLRTVPLQNGGTVCEQAKVTLTLESKKIAVKSTIVRISIDNEGPESILPHVLVAFHFHADMGAQNEIKRLIAHQQLRETEVTLQ